MGHACPLESFQPLHEDSANLLCGVLLVFLHVLWLLVRHSAPNCRCLGQLQELTHSRQRITSRIRVLGEVS